MPLPPRPELLLLPELFTPPLLPPAELLGVAEEPLLLEKLLTGLSKLEPKLELAELVVNTRFSKLPKLLDDPLLEFMNDPVLGL